MLVVSVYIYRECMVDGGEDRPHVSCHRMGLQHGVGDGIGSRCKPRTIAQTNNPSRRCADLTT